MAAGHPGPRPGSHGPGLPAGPRHGPQPHGPHRPALLAPHHDPRQPARQADGGPAPGRRAPGAPPPAGRGPAGGPGRRGQLRLLPGLRHRHPGGREEPGRRSRDRRLHRGLHLWRQPARVHPGGHARRSWSGRAAAHGAPRPSPPVGPRTWGGTWRQSALEAALARARTTGAIIRAQDLAAGVAAKRRSWDPPGAGLRGRELGLRRHGRRGPGPHGPALPGDFGPGGPPAPASSSPACGKASP